MDPLYSFVFSRASARQAFPEIGADQLILAVLAGVPAGGASAGCAVFLGPPPEDPEATVCVGTGGPGADHVQQLLIEQLERKGVVVDAVYEGGPEPETILAEARDGRWSAPAS